MSRGGLRRRFATFACAGFLCLNACTSHDPAAPSATPASTSPSDDAVERTPDSPGPKDVAGRPRLTGGRPCPGIVGFACSTLTVPLDWSGRRPGMLELPVAVANGDRNDPLLLLLTGGPGQGGVAFLPRTATVLDPFIGDHRIVMLDQRGTGANAIAWADLQEAVGGSDIVPPPPDAVRACAKTIGSSRSFFSTADTVADLEHLRRALKADDWVLNGISYGSFVAQRYALAHPQHVRGLILDSVVPHDGVEPLLQENLRRTAYVLRDVCKETSCSADPAKDLSWVVRHGGDGLEILNALTIQSIIDPSFREFADAPTILHEARAGDSSRLEDFIALAHRVAGFSSEELSAGLHAATLCSDTRFPWNEDASVDARRKALRRTAQRFSKRSFWPFDRATAVGNGLIETCLLWPATQTEPIARSDDFPNVPVLLLSGERDLSTPLAWANAVDRVAADDRFVVVPDGGHSTQFAEANDRPLAEVGRFLRRLE